MDIRELYNEAVKDNREPLILLLDFLLFEKQTIKFEDDTSVLDVYFLPKHKERMNKLLIEYREDNQ